MSDAPPSSGGHPGVPRAPPDFDELFVDESRLTIDDVKAALEYAQHLVQSEATLTP